MTITKISFRRGQTTTNVATNNQLNAPITAPNITTTKNLQVPSIVSSIQTVGGVNVKDNDKTRYALPRVIKPAPEGQKKIVDTGPKQPKILISKDKKTETEEPKKRGRPSKEEIEKREKERLEEENRIKDQLIQNGPNAIKETVKIPIIPDPTIPLFKVGEYVRDKIVIGKKIFKGIVVRQDLDSPRYVYVAWKDGSKQWHGAVSLERITLADYKRKSTPDEIDAAELDAAAMLAAEKKSAEEKETDVPESM